MAFANTTPSLVGHFTQRRARHIAPLALILLLVGGLYQIHDINQSESFFSADFFFSHGTPNTPNPLPPTPTPEIDYSRFAYTQYVTNSAYLCNSVMLFAKLAALGSQADRLMMYPSTMLPDPDAGKPSSLAVVPETNDARLIIKARDLYNVKLAPISVQHRDGADPTWSDSFTKLLAFNQTQYDRVLSLDSDSIILQHMDELFLSPPATVAMPRAYWLHEDHTLSSQLVLATPNAEEFARIQARVASAMGGDYDMEILNDLYKDSALIIPHRPYNILTGEFKDATSHALYLGNPDETWDPVAVYNEAKFLHFSDYPIQKPWLETSPETWVQSEPSCVTREGGELDCVSRDLWKGFYAEFRMARKYVCG